MTSWIKYAPRQKNKSKFLFLSFSVHFIASIYHNNLLNRKYDTIFLVQNSRQDSITMWRTLPIASDANSARLIKYNFAWIAIQKIFYLWLSLQVCAYFLRAILHREMCFFLRETLMRIAFTFILAHFIKLLLSNR